MLSKGSGGPDGTPSGDAHQPPRPLLGSLTRAATLPSVFQKDAGTTLDGCRGAYLMLMAVSSETILRVGSLGQVRFRPGIYGYVGSGRGNGSSSVAKRIGRHLRPWRKPFWHIDYLLNASSVSRVAAILVCRKSASECRLNHAVLMLASASIPNFGSSDCRGDCGSHLSYFESERVDRILNCLLRAIRRLGFVRTIMLASKGGPFQSQANLVSG